MPPSLVSPYTPRVGTQILLTDLHWAIGPLLFLLTSRRQSHCFDKALGDLLWTSNCAADDDGMSA
jgi:hypothetical protein